MAEVAIETSVFVSTAASPVNIGLNITGAVKALVLLHSQVDDGNGADVTAMWNTDEAFTELVDFETTWTRADVYIMYLNNPTAGAHNVTVTRLTSGRGGVYIWALTDCGVFPVAMIDSATAEVNTAATVNAVGLAGPAGSMALGGGTSNQAGAKAPVGGCVEDHDAAVVDGHFWAGHDLDGDNIGFTGAVAAQGCAAILVKPAVGGNQGIMIW